MIVPHLTGKGGVANYWKSLLPHLKQKEGEFTVFEMGGQTGAGLAHFITDQLRLWRLLSSKQFDVSHLNPSLDLKSFIRELLFILALRLRGIPFVITFHGWEKPLAEKIRKRWKWLVKHTYLKAEKINVLASSFRSSLLTWGYVNEVAVQTTCVNTELIDNIMVSKKHVNESEPIRVLYISRIVKAKGVLETIMAVESISNEFNVELTIAGDGEYFDEVRGYVLQNNLSNVKLLGYVSGNEKTSLFQTHHILCFPTYYPEGLPISILEGIATGCVLVCTNVGGIADVFVDGQMGSLCKPDPGDIAEKLKYWVGRPDSMNQVMVGNNHFGKTHLGANVLASAIYDQYLKVLQKEC